MPLVSSATRLTELVLTLASLFSLAQGGMGNSLDRPVLAQSPEDRGFQEIQPSPPRQGSDRRVALVMGNSAYETISPLQNPVNDAQGMTEALTDLGFDRVITIYDANLEEMREAVDDFYHELKRGSVGVFYYAGHGVQSNGENYLIPVDAQID